MTITKMLDFSDRHSIAQAIQFTNVRPQLTRDGAIAHIETCGELGVHAAMIGPVWVALASEILRGSSTRVATTLNFPQGNDTTEMKVAIVPYLAQLGADEFDFPPNTGFLLSGMVHEYGAEIQAVTDAAHRHGMVAKAMLEFGFLSSDALRRQSVSIACEAGVDWVKQSSGWGEGGIEAVPEDVALMREILRPPTRIKVSGKINSRAKMEVLFREGAEMVGTSSAVEILQNLTGDASAY